MSKRQHGSVDHERLDRLRRGQGPIGEHIIDELLAGNLSRRDFLRHATKAGIALPLAGAILSACGASSSAKTTTTSRPSAVAKSGATLRAGFTVPTGVINPITINDGGGTDNLDQVGEWLVFADEHLVYHPWLATSWSASPDATVWTFKIRQGVKFNDGSPMTVDDVVYSFKSQCNPKSSANALSVFGGTLEPSGVVKVDDNTVAFHLIRPDGGFIDAVCQTNYNMIIVPNNYEFSNYQKDFIGTGRFMKTSYTPSVGASFVRNPHYWGTPAKPKELHVTFYASEAAQTAALEGGTIDSDDGFSVASSPQLLTGNFNVTVNKSSDHRELSMRCDIIPFTNKYVRQAIAYTLDRPAIVHALFKGYADVGNDSPFAPIFVSTNHSVPQREQNLSLAKQLLAKGGVPNGFSTHLYTELFQEVPDFAQIVKASAAKIGVDIALTVETTTKYYGNAVFGQSDWLDGDMSLVDYAPRGVPNVLLEEPLQSINNKTGQGAWNAARFNNSEYDKLSNEFVAAPDLATQRKLAGEIEELLLDETPIIYPYWIDELLAMQKNITGVQLVSGGLFFWNAGPT